MTTQTQTLADFLLARADDARRRSDCYPDPPIMDEYRMALSLRRLVAEHHRSGSECATCFAGVGMDHGDVVATGKPWPCPTLRLLALPYADHPDFREEWRP